MSDAYRPATDKTLADVQSANDRLWYPPVISEMVEHAHDTKDSKSSRQELDQLQQEYDQLLDKHEKGERSEKSSTRMREITHRMEDIVNRKGKSSDAKGSGEIGQFLQGAGKYPLSILKTPTGKFMFVGTVPAKLAYQPGNNNIWNKREEAVKAARAEGFEVE